jgi:hypothetical protein
MVLLALVGGPVPGSGAADKPSPAQENHLAPLERLLGGEWVVHGKWKSGETLHARNVIAWGLGKKFITAKTFVKDGDKEYQRYEAVFAWHPRKKSLVQYSFAFDGNLSETIVEAKDKDTLHVGWTPFAADQPSNVRQVLHFTDKDTFVWTVSIKTDGGWKELIEATWHRERK